ncbi:Ig domain-containing protein [Paenibacillus kribbensis]|uniref:Ig domain-containing protein n=1 Tax=Paenibacillus kribbensis TaxID=172713 RepID=UPI000838666B|nr:Ig domain-containing protein [Paenibacillus kribbensis]
MNTQKRRTKMWLIALAVSLIVALTPAIPGHEAYAEAESDAKVIDIFSRTVNDYGIELVDWQGYLANPYVKLKVKPPADAVFPVTITLNAQGTSRLMMDLPSTLSAQGASKTLTFANAQEEKDFRLAIHPDRIGGNGEIEHYTLSLSVAGNDGRKTTQSIPIRVLDQDDNEEPQVPIHFDYRFDTIMPYFNDAATRKAAELAVKDWFYFFDLSPFDEVPANAEVNHLPGDDWQNEIQVTNDKPYKGMWVFLRGLNGPYSTGFPANNGNYHTRNGVTVPGNLNRSYSLILDFYDDATPFTSVDDEEWYQSDLSKVTDVHGLIMHEFGHAIVFSDTFPGVRALKEAAGNDPDILAYQHRPAALDDSYHLSGELAEVDRLSGQNGGWRHMFPTRRWMNTKLSLLVAEKAGWPLRKDLTPFLAPEIVTKELPAPVKGKAYTAKLEAKGGVPFYDWTVTGGQLPAGFTLDRFTGTISGTAESGAANKTYTFTVQLRDYDELSKPVTQSFTLKL